jgi:membrane associated rhomboid family serine protease
MGRLFANLTQETAKTYGRILSAGHIDYKIESTNHLFCIEVDPVHRPAACRAIARHLGEKRSAPAKAPVSLGPPAHNFWSALLAALFLVAVHGAIGPGETRLLFIRNFGADAGPILSGQLFRCVTALLLHTDALHLLTNVFGIVIFGTAVVSYCGWGAGWLMILLAGAAGNWMTARWYGQAHLSIGSSTAVFAAVGLSAALMSRIFTKRHEPSWRSWMPVIGAAALVGMMGLAPHADQAAHLSGFASGLLFGWVHNRRFQPAAQRKQLIYAFAAALLVAGCCIWGWANAS